MVTVEDFPLTCKVRVRTTTITDPIAKALAMDFEHVVGRVTSVREMTYLTVLLPGGQLILCTPDELERGEYVRVFVPHGKRIEVV
jgi:hypothetical protein